MTLKKCPSCGHQHDSADIICPYCKHSYSNKKIICNNCGAYLQPSDKFCYVCGEIIRQERAEAVAPPVIEEKPVAEPVADFGEVFAPIVEDIQDYAVAEEENTYQEISPETDEPKKKPKKKGAKKVAMICTIIVLVVALLGAGVCVAHFNGWLVPPKTEEATITVYFEKPMTSQNLMTAEGTVYNWTGDVDINYILDGKAYKKPCKMTNDYDNVWFKKLPAKATQVYFSETSLEVVRTVAVEQAVDGNIYYVTDILFDSNMQLPVDCCKLADFDSMGINYYTAPVETEKPTEKPTETQQETQAETEPEPETEAEVEAYSLSVPQQWQGNYTVIENGNCTSYYETYNYSNYQCGNLFSVYVYDANDTSYSEMNVEKVVTTSDGTKKIVVVTPTDIQFNDGDDTAIEKYTTLSQFTNQVVESVKAN